MKTAVFMLLLRRLAKGLMSAEEYASFSTKINLMRWQQLRQGFPDIWEKFSEQFNEVKEQFSRLSDPEIVIEAIVPGSIEHYPELFEPFRLQLDQIKTGVDLGAEALTSAIDVTPDLANGIDASVLIDGAPAAEVVVDGASDTAANVISWIVEMLFG